MGAVPIQTSDFCTQTCKININIAWKNSQCEYVKKYHFWTQNVNKPLQQSKITIELKNHSLEWVSTAPPTESQQFFLTSEIAWKIAPCEQCPGIYQHLLKQEENRSCKIMHNFI